MQNKRLAASAAFSLFLSLPKSHRFDLFRPWRAERCSQKGPIGLKMMGTQSVQCLGHRCSVTPFIFSPAPSPPCNKLLLPGGIPPRDTYPQRGVIWELRKLLEMLCKSRIQSSCGRTEVNVRGGGRCCRVSRPLFVRSSQANPGERGSRVPAREQLELPGCSAPS